MQSENVRPRLTEVPGGTAAVAAEDRRLFEDAAPLPRASGPYCFSRPCDRRCGPCQLSPLRNCYLLVVIAGGLLFRCPVEFALSMRQVAVAGARSGGLGSGSVVSIAKNAQIFPVGERVLRLLVELGSGSPCPVPRDR